MPVLQGFWLLTIVDARPWRSSRIKRSLRSAERHQAPAVNDEELNAPERLEHAAIASVAARQRERLEETRDAMIEY